MPIKLNLVKYEFEKLSIDSILIIKFLRDIEQGGTLNLDEFAKDVGLKKGRVVAALRELANNDITSYLVQQKDGQEKVFTDKWFDKMLLTSQEVTFKFNSMGLYVLGQEKL